ncbi:MAG: hypothetical protein ACJA0N_001519 [Pseudohongiellaceae bacterium]|jgi:hypothetical protein
MGSYRASVIATLLSLSHLSTSTVQLVECMAKGRHDKSFTMKMPA